MSCRWRPPSERRPVIQLQSQQSDWKSRSNRWSCGSSSEHWLLVVNTAHDFHGPEFWRIGHLPTTQAQTRCRHVIESYQNDGQTCPFTTVPVNMPQSKHLRSVRDTTLVLTVGRYEWV